jgi:outer membrane protein TolC
MNMPITAIATVATIKMMGVAGLLWMALLPPVQAALTLEKAVTIALKYDPWLRGNELKKQALEANSIAAKSLPDPVVSLGLLNLPSDGFALDQEPMTQIKIGLAQTFPRGDSLAIRHKQLSQLAGQHPLLAEDRKARVELSVSQLWLQAFKAEQSIRLIENDRALFEQLAEIVQASYSSAQGKTRQQDVVRAQLELSRLDDRLVILHEQGDMAVARLMEWLVAEPHNTFSDAEWKKPVFPDFLPPLAPLLSGFRGLLNSQNRQTLAEILAQHPAVLAVEQRIQAGFTGVQLAEQKYQPQWGVNGSYAYREDEQNGRSRADFFSLGLSFDLPLFSTNRQDQEVASSRMQAESMKTDKLLLMRKMMAQLAALYARHQGMSKRLNLYKDSILPQLHEQAEAALIAYTNDDGDFAEVMRARIAELNGRIEQIAIATEQLATQIHIHYFFTGSRVSIFAAQGVTP